ncbi:hypothetical protein NLI96_g6305 [Meripilus lineatus]|uniref:Uncharacterized protein n=1 Tax=Meripilus lineatus TaxID=2056292 RepID=A0AAD5YD38_9APHY|nr:hypothetical protein NLI96_g6305 [Physisporinus lineatus]
MTDSSGYPNLSESEQRKRKQTLERAKANYLSGQLRLRLQYAKLKVEHGWQRQNLNEVENLYFRHSHMRKPTVPTAGPSHPTHPSVSAEHSIITTGPSAPESSQATEPASQPDPSSSGYPSSSQQPPELTRTETQGTDISQAHAPPPSQGLSQASSVVFNGSTLPTSELPSQPQINTTNVAPSPSPPLASSVPPKPKRTRARFSNTTRPKSINNRSASNSQHSPSIPNSTPSSSRLSQPPDNPDTTSNANNTPSQPSQSSSTKPSPPSRTGSSTGSTFTPSSSTGAAAASSSAMFGSSSSIGSPLTYDSFWSSHSLSTQTYRSLLSTTTSLSTVSSQLGNGSATNSAAEGTQPSASAR